MTIPRETEQVYRYGMDDVLREAQRTTPADEVAADELFAHARGRAGVLPTGYIVRAVIRCNQIDTFRMVACDWRERVEIRREKVEAICRDKLGGHLRAAHPYLTRTQVRDLLNATSYNLRDIGR